MHPTPAVVATSLTSEPWVRAIVYVVIAVVAARVVDWVFVRRDQASFRLRGEPSPSEKTRLRMARRLLVAAILFVGVALALLQFAVVGSLARAMLASAAIFAAVFGFAARAPIANLASGVFIAFSQPVRIGDYVSVDGMHGVIEEIKLTYTTIRTADDRRIVIPNEVFASKVVENYSIDDQTSAVLVELPVPLTTPLDDVKRVMLEEATALSAAPPGRAHSVEVAEVGTDKVVLRLMAWTGDPLERRTLAAGLRERIVTALLARGLLDPGAQDGG
jgi:small conductance mechanosensitive channel